MCTTIKSILNNNGKYWSKNIKIVTYIFKKQVTRHEVCGCFLLPYATMFFHILPKILLKLYEYANILEVSLYQKHNFLL